MSSQLAVSILFVGYVLMQVPSNLFLNKFGKPSLYLSTCVSHRESQSARRERWLTKISRKMVIWGIISLATAGVQNVGGLLAIRLMLGIIEAAYFVGYHGKLRDCRARDDARIARLTKAPGCLSLAASTSSAAGTRAKSSPCAPPFCTRAR